MSYYGAAFNWSQPVLFGELAIMLWLLIKGAKDPGQIDRVGGEPAKRVAVRLPVFL